MHIQDYEQNIYGSNISLKLPQLIFQLKLDFQTSYSKDRMQETSTHQLQEPTKRKYKDID